MKKKLPVFEVIIKKDGGVDNILLIENTEESFIYYTTTKQEPPVGYEITFTCDSKLNYTGE